MTTHEEGHDPAEIALMMEQNIDRRVVEALARITEPDRDKLFNRSGASTDAMLIDIVMACIASRWVDGPRRTLLRQDLEHLLQSDSQVSYIIANQEYIQDTIRQIAQEEIRDALCK